jgi:DedD protein
MWAVQLGSFSNQANAERLAAELRKEGYAAFLSRVQASSEVLHRVRVGPQQNRESAEQVAARLGSDGHKGQVVPHP